MNPDVKHYNSNLVSEESDICNLIATIINKELSDAENKIWHSHPVWFLDGNPIVGYSNQKAGIRLMFWSGADFEEPQLNVLGKKFKDASIFYKNVQAVHQEDIIRWLKKSRDIQWDYKNIVKRKGKLLKLGVE